MSPTKPSESKKASVVHFISLLVALVLAIAYAGCTTDTNKNGTQQSATQQIASPSPTPSPSASPSPDLIPGDTIIVIKDGSVDIQVTMSLCTDVTNPSGPDFSYRCDNRDLDNMEIKTNAPGSSTVKANPTSKITIDGGGDKKIVIKGNPRQVKIDFRKADYPLCGSQPGHHCGSNHVGTITMDTPPFNKNCNPSEGCDVHVKVKNPATSP